MRLLVFMVIFATLIHQGQGFEWWSKAKAKLADAKDYLSEKAGELKDYVTGRKEEFKRNSADIKTDIEMLTECAQCTREGGRDWCDNGWCEDLDIYSEKFKDYLQCMRNHRDTETGWTTCSEILLEPVASKPVSERKDNEKRKLETFLKELLKDDHPPLGR